LLSSSHSLTDAAAIAAHNKWQPTYNLHYTLALPFHSTCGNRNQNLGITLVLSSSPCTAFHFFFALFWHVFSLTSEWLFWGNFCKRKYFIKG
jgi:hypothetical protein